MDHTTISDYMAHGFCLLWEPQLVWLHVISDILTGIAYYSIPIAMFYFAYKRRDLPFLKTFILFGVFILACGTTHFLAAYTVYVPAYWQQGIVKAITAVVSVLSAILFIPMLPKAIALPSLTKALEDVRQLNIRLKNQLDENQVAAKALADSETRLRSIVQTAQDAIISISRDNEIVLWNKGAEQIFGYTSDEALGNDISIIMPPRHIQPHKQAVEQFFATGRLKYNGKVLELSGLRKDGSEFPIELSVATWETTDGVFFTGIIRDVSERKQIEEDLHKSERNYRSLFETINDGIYRSTIDGRFTMLNPAGARMLGYDSPDDAIGQSAIQHWEDPEDRRRFIEILGKEHSVRFYAIRALRKDGKNVLMELSARLLTNANEDSVGIEGIMRDVTAQKHLETQLRQAQKMEAIGHLAGGIAHDFNNILTGIIGYYAIIDRKMKTDDPSRPHLSVIKDLALKAANLTNSLLAFSRKQVIDVKNTSINDIVFKMQNILSRIIGEDIKLTAQLALEDLTAKVDRGQIEQVLMNLVTNARDAMPNGGTLTISTQKQAIDENFVRAHHYGEIGNYVLISVSDTGIGMDEKTKEQIFEPFFSTKEVGKGTGLGLAMVYGIIKQHNGFINLYSEPNQGTIFRIYLPLAESEKEGEIIPEKIPLPTGNETILLVEDDQSVMNVTKLFLEDCGYKVIEAVDGDEALKVFIDNKDSIKLVISDLILPKKHGKDFYNDAKKIVPGMKVLFMSGYTADVISTKGLLPEGMNFMTKPVDPDKMLRRVREILDS
ncbi:MAG: PAS domain S-box protein [Nitrospirae bacterium]|nr:PAS domain S-box protein [Nitrospirota bacterium]